MTPKSLLRLHQATSCLDDLASGRFAPVLAEPDVDPVEVRRLILCSGKIYYDLAGHAARQDNPRVAVGRVELLYPFPQHELLELIASDRRLHEVVWVPEEPRNIGAERASPGEGYPVAHAAGQTRIVAEAFNLDSLPSPDPPKPPGER